MENLYFNFFRSGYALLPLIEALMETLEKLKGISLSHGSLFSGHVLHPHPF
jgi:hypothetical protein